MKCDICSNPIFTDYTAISAEDMRQAVFKKGFTPWKAGLRSDLISSDVETYWKQNVAQDQSDWHICPTCMKKLNTYLVGKPKARGIGSWAVSQDKNDLQSAMAAAEANYQTKNQSQWLVRLAGLVLLVIGLGGLVASLAADWAVVPVDVSGDGPIYLDGPMVITEDGVFATKKTVMETNLIIGAILMGGLGLVGVAGLFMFYPEVVNRLNKKRQTPAQINTRMLAAVGSVLALAAPFGYKLLSNNELESGWRNAAFAAVLAALVAAVRWFLPEVQIPEASVEEKPAVEQVAAEVVEAEEEEEEEAGRREFPISLILLAGAVVALVVVGLNFLGNKLDDSDPSGAAVEVPATTRPLPTWTARPLPTALPTTEVVFPTDTSTALPSETPFVPTEVFAPTFVFTRTPRSTDESGPYVLQVSCPHPNRVLKVVFSPDSRQVVIGDEYGNVQIMEVGGCEPIKKLEKHMYSITALAFSPGGSVLASQSGDIYLRDYQNAALVGTLSPGEVSINTTLAFSPDGKFLASSGENLLIWNFETRSLMKTITTGGYASSVAFSPDGQQMASTSYIVGGMEVVLWDTTSWTEIRRLQIDQGVVPQVAFSPDGKWLATSGDHRVQIWNMDDFSLQYESAYESSYALKIAFSPDSSLLAFSSKGLVHVIDFMSKEEMTTLVTHGDINALAFSPDGLWLASANGIFDSPDNYFYVWYVGG